MNEPCIGTGLTVSITVTATLNGCFDTVNDLERAIVEATRAAGRQLYAEGFAAFQSAWLEGRKDRFIAQRWRAIDWLTPFGQVDLPARVVRQRDCGRYLTIWKVLFRHKATRLLSPALEQEACAAATEQNYRPTAP